MQGKYNIVEQNDDIPSASVVTEEEAAIADLAEQQHVGSIGMDQYSWTDDYFSNDSSVIAVFDHDQEALHTWAASMISMVIAIFASVAAFISLILTIDDIDLGDSPNAIYWLISSLTIILFSFTGMTTSWIAVCLTKDLEAHTAVTNSGIRHVRVPARNGVTTSTHYSQCVIHIPFEVIDSITVEQMRAKNSNGYLSTVKITTKDTKEDVDLIVSGIPTVNTLKKDFFMPNMHLALEGICEPYQFKKLVLLKMREKCANDNAQSQEEEQPYIRGLVQSARAIVDGGELEVVGLARDPLATSNASSLLETVRELRDELGRYNDAMDAKKVNQI
jgi:hypothetical protein